MQDRWVSYIFRYKDNRKCENAGYIKTLRTSRSGVDQVKIDIGLRLIKPIVCRCRMYLIYDSRELILLDELLIGLEERDIICYKKTYAWSDLLREGCCLKDYEGIFFAVDDGDTLMSVWSDRELICSDLHIIDDRDKIVSEDGDSNLNSSIDQIGTIPIPDYLMYPQNNLTYDKDLGENIQAANNEKPQEEPRDEAGLDSTFDFDSIEYMLRNSIKLPKFTDSPLVDCVKIIPQDIGKLPMGNWKLGQNSFLVHGYYRYKYIMLGIVKYDQQESCVIGVPGVFTNKEKYLANMFGFNVFIPVKNTDRKTGSFGYWVWEVLKE